MHPKVKSVKLDSSEKYQRLLNPATETSGIKAGHVILKSNENIGEHTTGGREEIIIILKGKAEVKIGKGDTMNIEKDEVLYIPPQTGHDIKNSGPEILEYIFITSNV